MEKEERGGDQTNIIRRSVWLSRETERQQKTKVPLYDP